MAKRDYYQVLGVDRSATAAQIKSAYRKLAREFHPDVNKATDAAEKFTEATEAYEVLSDDAKRQKYDRFGHASNGGGFGGPRGPGGVDFSDIFGGQAGGGGGFMGMGLDDILQALGGRGRRRRPQKGADLEYPITLDFLQAVRGVATAIRLRSGRKGETDETLDVKIPAGVRDGQKIRVRGKGQEGPAGPGDLYILVHVAKHAYFSREGRDIVVEVPVSITEAALGAKVDVPTIDGPTTVKIPHGTNSGQKLRLKGKGVGSAGDDRGDQYVIVRTVVPKDISKAGRQLLEQLAESEKFDVRADSPWNN